MITISTMPKEKSTAIISLAFTDEGGAAVTPTELSWQLQRINKTIVNGRSFAVSPVAGSEVVLSGLDLAIFGASDSGARIFSIHGLYDSAAGVGLPINDEIKFNIERLVSQTDVV